MLLRRQCNSKASFKGPDATKIGEMKIPRHKANDVFQHGPVHEPVRNISVFHLDFACHKSGKRDIQDVLQPSCLDFCQL